MKFLHLILLALAASPLLALEGPELANRQCRSIHLGYQSPPSEWGLIEILPKQSAPGTYFCALGFNKGYFGMQELADGKKIIIFSVWDAPDKNNQTDRPNDTDESLRAGVIKVGDGVRQQRFGGEGTGCQSFFDYDWKIDQPVRFAVHAKPEGDFTTYSGFFYDASRKTWQLMASFRTHSKVPLQGFYSFIEDFRRNYESAKIIRRAEFLNGWALTMDGKWLPLTNARFTADATPSDAIDADPVKNGFFLQTGGTTTNAHTKLWQPMTRPTPPAKKPDLTGIPGLKP